MALAPCAECGREVSTLALSCPQCGAPVSAAPAAAPAASPPGKSEGRGSVWKWIIGVPIAAFAGLMIIGTISNNSPEGRARTQARSAIELCWQTQQKKSLDPSTSRIAAGACESMEADFRRKFGANP